LRLRIIEPVPHPAQLARLLLLQLVLAESVDERLQLRPSLAQSEMQRSWTRAIVHREEMKGTQVRPRRSSCGASEAMRGRIQWNSAQNDHSARLTTSRCHRISHPSRCESPANWYCSSSCCCFCVLAAFGHANVAAAAASISDDGHTASGRIAADSFACARAAAIEMRTERLSESKHKTSSRQTQLIAHAQPLLLNDRE